MLTQEEIIDNESNISNIFKVLKQKYKIDSMVHDIQKNVNKDNAQHVEQLERQKRDIQRLRE